MDIIKADGSREIFDSSKLESSLKKAGATTEAIKQVVKHINDELVDGMTTKDIYEHAFSILKEWEEPVAKRYSLRHALMNLGPTGFLFEDLVAEILKAKGYEVQTRQNVLGGCVPHEVDVVAWDEKDLIMVEAKFHNGFGTKSDLKVALYVKARWDDLRENVFNYGGKDRKMTQSWLVTNTKFSSTAIHYGECQKMTMIGWNYPEKGNLEDLINENPNLIDLIYKNKK